MPVRRRPAEAALRAFALGYPETTEDFPWGERALKVRGKVFVFMSKDAPELSLSVKLPEKRLVASLAGASPARPKARAARPAASRARARAGRRTS